MITTIQRLKEENERLNHRAGHDWLTGLYDREAAEEKINRLIQERGCGVMILLDVDRFRRINSRYGHIVGDHVLSSIAAVLDSMVFRHDVVGRVDDDEFVVFMPVNQDEKFLQQRGGSRGAGSQVSTERDFCSLYHGPRDRHNLRAGGRLHRRRERA